MRTFKNETWLYANSLGADPNICGYYVGVANQGGSELMFQIIRSGALALKAAAVGVMGVLMYSLL